MLYVFVWIILYGGIHIVSQFISRAFHIAQWSVSIAMLLYVICFLTWILSTGRERDIGLCIAKPLGRMKSICFIPLFVVPLLNIYITGGKKIVFFTVVYMICVSVIEEIFFRGFLLHYLMKKSKLYGIVVSSLIFAVFHFVNLFRHQDYVYIIMQVLCAFVVGICYAAIVVRYHTLIPCFVAHALTNITGANAVSPSISYDKMVGLWICIIIYTIYGISLCRKIS